MTTKIKNMCIMAHVDHGKTTLVDEVIKFTNEGELKQSMDKNDLERERGITILAKATCIDYFSKFSNIQYKLHIVDTPGHADFGSEVERILSMIEMAVLLVDAAEGIMPQTEFVLRKAVEAGKHIFVIINKIDKPESRIEEVESEIFDLLVSLNYEKVPKFFYGSGRQAYFSSNLEVAKNISNYPDKKNLEELLETLAVECPEPNIQEGSFKFLVTLLDYDMFFKKIYIGKIYSGNLQEGDNITAINEKGEKIDNFRILKLFKFIGANKIPIEKAQAGDIIGIAGGSEDITVNDTLCSINSDFIPIPSRPIDPPTMSVEIKCNTSPFAGKDTTNKNLLTFNSIKKRLEEEARTNVGIKLEYAGKSESIQLKFRGELQLGILLENMRREGFELTVMKPKVLFTSDNKEPVELIVIETSQEYVSGILNEMNNRKAVVEDIIEVGGKSRLIFKCPTRFLMGFESIIKSNTCGNAVINRIFNSYEDNYGILNNNNGYGLLISSSKGMVTQYALEGLSVSNFFVEPGDEVYEGQIVGANSRPGDMQVNPTKMKALTNFRTQSSEGIKDKQQIEKLTMAEVIDRLNNANPTTKKTEICLEITPKRLVLRSIFI